MRRLDRGDGAGGGPDGDYADAEDGTYFHLTDAQFSTVAVVDQTGSLIERVGYTPYGEGRHHWPGDLDGDGAVTTGSNSDLTLFNQAAGSSIGDANYNVDADLDRDGDVDNDDLALVSATTALRSGLISDPDGPDNPFGYDGYVFNAESLLYCVRFRWYDRRSGGGWNGTRRGTSAAK